MTQIKDTLLKVAPKFAEDYADYVRRFYNDHVEEFGNKWARNGMTNSTAARWNQLVAGCFVRAPGESEYAPHPKRVFSEEKLQEQAERYGIEVATAWGNKIESKLENVKGIDFTARDAGSFQFNGTREGRSIRLEQQTVTKFNKAGRMYHQFPARIYVDGQFLSEKAYKELFV